MKRALISVLVIGATLFFLSCPTRNAAQTVNPAPANGAVPAAAGASSTATQPPIRPWPLAFSDNTATYTVFQPQCDFWDGHQFIGRSAISIQPYGQSQPTYGVMEFSAITLVDKDTQTVKLADVKFTGTDFSGANGGMQSYLATLRATFSKDAPPLDLDNLEGSFVYNPPEKPERLMNTPPNVVISQRPAVLISLDGPPAWRAVPGADLDRAINTRVLLLRDQSGVYYLHVFDGYLQSYSLEGPWTVAAHVPAGVAVAQKAAVDSGQVDLMQGTPDPVTHVEPSLNTSAIPEVFVETAPSELITFSGAPEYAPIPGTDLLYADNTSANVFKLLTDQQNYILISGRWYRAPSLNGPWQFVPGNQLPPDFAEIPDTSPKENVKASVPGTPEANEALIANSIPQSAAVPVTDQMQNPRIDGALQLAPIEGTPLYYVVNSATPIIEVNPELWYACQDGVWYDSMSANGPWTVATSVPSVIYTIPASSPLYYVTYVQVYGSSPGEVYEGYTPGYFGTEVADDGTVVYGTGYDYTPWIGADWYGPPITWGCGFDDCWTPWLGWGFDCGFGWGCGYPGFGWWCCYPPFPWWGGYACFHDYDHNGFRHFDRDDFANTGANFYHQGYSFDAARRQFAEDDFTGQAGRFTDYGRSYNSRTGQIAAGQWAQVQRVSGSAWSPARNIAGTGNYGFNGFAMRNNIATAPRNYSFGLNNYRQAFTPFNDQSRPLYTPRYGGEFRNYSLGGWRGNGAVVAPRGGGFFNNYFRGGAPAGGFRGGGGWAGGHVGGAGGGGGGWGGGGHGAGGGGWGGGGGGGGHGGR